MSAISKGRSRGLGIERSGCVLHIEERHSSCLSQDGERRHPWKTGRLWINEGLSGARNNGHLRNDHRCSERIQTRVYGLALVLIEVYRVWALCLLIEHRGLLLFYGIEEVNGRHVHLGGWR